MINVSIIDDESSVIHFFRQTTLELSDVVCVNTAKSIEDFLDNYIKTRSKHFLFLDIHLEHTISISHIPRILEKIPEIEIIMYSNDEQFNYLMTSFKLGAIGYVVKQFDKENLKDFFNILSKGGAAISPSMAKKLINSINNDRTEGNLKTQLSTKELEVLTHLSEGWTYQFIADEMEISVDGIRYYIKKIYKKLKVNSRAEAVKVFQNLF